MMVLFEKLISCWYKCIKNVWDKNTQVTCKQTSVTFLKERIKKLNNEIEFKIKYLEGRGMLMENFINGHFKFE